MSRLFCHDQPPPDHGLSGWPKRGKKRAEGRLARLRKRMTTCGGYIFEKGEVLRVEYVHGGLHLSTVTQCPTCESKHRRGIRKVGYDDVDLLPEGWKPSKCSAPRFPEEIRGMLRRIMALRKQAVKLELPFVVEALAVCARRIADDLGYGDKVAGLGDDELFAAVRRFKEYRA